MIRASVLHITLFCALLLQSAACGRAWAADSGLNWSRPDPGDPGDWHTPRDPDEPRQAGIFSYTGPATGGEVKIYTDSGVWIVYGGASTGGEASHNTVTIQSGAVATIYGGASNNGTVSHNTVKVYDGIVRGGVAGGYTAGNGNAEYNSVEIHNSIVQDTIYGGNSAEGHAYYNTVRILGGTLGNVTNVSNIIGGYTANVGTGRAEQNTVILSGAPVFNETTPPGIYGGIVVDISKTPAEEVHPDSAFLGNTLILDRYKGTSTVGPIANFQYFAFTLDEDFQPLKSGTVSFGNGEAGDQLRKSSVTSINTTGIYAPRVGSSVTLIQIDTTGGGA